MSIPTTKNQTEFWVEMLTRSPKPQQEQDYQENLRLLNRLPFEVWDKILGFLPSSDRRNFRRVSRGCWQIINGNEKLKRESIGTMVLDDEELSIKLENGRWRDFNDFAPIAHIFQSLDIGLLISEVGNRFLAKLFELLKRGNAQVENIWLKDYECEVNLNEFLWLANPRWLSICLYESELDEMDYVIKIPPGCEGLRLSSAHYRNFDLETATNLKGLYVGVHWKYSSFFHFSPQSAGTFTNRLLELISKNNFCVFQDDVPSEKMDREALEMGIRMSRPDRWDIVCRLVLVHEQFTENDGFGIDPDVRVRGIFYDD